MIVNDEANNKNSNDALFLFLDDQQVLPHKRCLSTNKKNFNA